MNNQTMLAVAFSEAGELLISPQIMDAQTIGESQA